jgi:hypothetical protein
MHIDSNRDEVTIAQARVALRLATGAMHKAVDTFLRRHGYTANVLGRQIALTYRVHGRIEAIKHVREILNCSLIEGMHVVDSLNDRLDLRTYPRLHGEAA